MDLAIGKVYDITHSRMGSFVFEPTRDSGEWIEGVVRAGKAKAMMAYNEADVGESLTIRKSFITRAVEL